MSFTVQNITKNVIFDTPGSTSLNTITDIIRWAQGHFVNHQLVL